jgi:hypothetical protein
MGEIDKKPTHPGGGHYKKRWSNSHWVDPVPPGSNQNVLVEICALFQVEKEPKAVGICALCQVEKIRNAVRICALFQVEKEPKAFSG